jgi:hypothetical protein
MFKTAAIFLSIVGSTFPAIAQDKAPKLPENTIDCKQFKKTGPQEWIEVGTAVFDLGEIKDIHLTDQPVIPRYFKFGGIDLYPVVEQKCGVALDGNPADSAPQSPVTMAKSEPARDTGGSMPSPTAKGNINLAVPEKKAVASPLENSPCADKKTIYGADGVADADGVKSLFEIVFETEINGDGGARSHSDFMIRESRNNQIEWSLRGQYSQTRLASNNAQPKQENSGPRFLFEVIKTGRDRPVALAANYLKPNRSGTGEAILYLGGLREIFSSKETVRRLKFEGGHPSDAIPEVFYFDRCE